MEVDFISINNAFTKQSPHYDEDDERNAILVWMRKMVRNHVSDYLKEGDRILELNAGSGIDAVYFSRNGNVVHATDLSDGMTKEIETKIKKFGLEQKLSCQQCSYTELDKV